MVWTRMKRSYVYWGRLFKQANRLSVLPFFLFVRLSQF